MIMDDVKPLQIVMYGSFFIHFQIQKKMSYKMDKSLATMGLAVVVSSVLILLLSQSTSVSARYLPTRSNGDRLERLEELLHNVSSTFF